MIHFVIALLPEAQPLIDYYHLKALPNSEPFKVYEGDDKRLIVSGVGKVQSASAATFLHVFSGGLRNQIWMNVGIGGHVSHNLSEGILAHKITDQVSGESWYPPIAFETPCPTEAVLTVEQPETHYQGPWIYEMEAAGFYSAATRFSTAELVQCFKIVSDNSQSSTKKVSPALAKRLIGNNLQTIDTILKHTTKLADELAPLEAAPLEFQKFMDRWHFTVSEQHYLWRLLKRIETLMPKTMIWSDEVQGLKKAKEVFEFLEEKINSLPVTL